MPRARLCVVLVHAGSEPPGPVLDAVKAAMPGEPPVSVRVARAAPGAVGEASRGCEGVVVVALTGGTEEALVEAAGLPIPAALAAIPYANSLPSLLEVAPLVRGRAAIAYLEGLKSPEAERRLQAVVRGVAAAARVRGARVGLVGREAPWLLYSKPNSPTLELVGVETVKVDVDELLSAIPAVPRAGLLERVLRGADPPYPPLDRVVAALRVYEGLRLVAGARGLDALAPSCPSFMEEAGSNACLAHALLNDDGIVTGCEGDVPSTVAALLLNAASRRPVFTANPAHVTEEEVLLAHCAAPLSLAARYQLRLHVLTRVNVSVAASLPAGVRWTIARLDPGKPRLLAGVGVAVDGSPGRPWQCETQLLLRMPGANRILWDSAGNHYVAVPGDYVEELRIAAGALGLEVDVMGGS